MKTYQRILSSALLGLLLICSITMLGLTACGPSEQQRVELEEKKRIECLDKFCEGDVEPKRDVATEVALKLNGQWYVGPKEYFSTGINGAGFEWWDHKPLSSKMKRPPEMQALAVDGKGYDFSVEVFLTGRQRWPTPNIEKPWETTWEQSLVSKRAEGKYIEQATIQPGLDEYQLFLSQGGKLDRVYYSATRQKRIRGDGSPIASCEPAPLHPRSTCTAGEFWQPDIYADFRFNAAHAKDWPEIHQEIIRVLSLLKKV